MYVHIHTHTLMYMCNTADARRSKFTCDTFGLRTGVTHCVRQNDKYIFEDVLTLYKDKAKDILLENPFRVRYMDGKQ